jgi:hypothetical protein
MLSLEQPFRAKLLDMYRAAPLDVASFYRHYKVCGKGECLGMCCNGGSGFYMKEEADTIRALVEENRNFFEAQGLPMPEKIFDEELNEETNEIEFSTNTREVKYPEGLKPEHFPDTACIFRRGDGACTLQVLGLEQGKPGWWYKPFACWLYPIELEHGGKPYIHVAHASTDEYVDETYPGFVGFTKCGAECTIGEGKPAYEILQYEIAELSKLLGRNLMVEIKAHQEKSA